MCIEGYIRKYNTNFVRVLLSKYYDYKNLQISVS